MIGKYRAWHYSQNKMISSEQLARDQLTLLADGRLINVSGESAAKSIIFDRDRFVPLFYTGFKSSDDTEIYQWDVIECHYYDDFGEWSTLSGLVDYSSSGDLCLIDNDGLETLLSSIISRSGETGVIYILRYEIQNEKI